MSDGLSFRFGGLDFQGTKPHQLGLSIVELEGWTESVKAVYEEIAIPGGDGSFEVPVYRSSRLVKATGYCKTETIGKLDWFHGAVTGQLGGETTRPFIAGNLGATEWAMAQCVRADFAPFGGQLFGDWQMDFWMPTPQKFGDTEVFPDGDTATHFGNTPAPPVFTIGGTRPAGYTIQGPAGRQLKVTLPIAAGTTHIYDMTTSELLVNGVLTDGGVQIADSWALAGGGSWKHTITGGTGLFQTAITKARI